MTSWVLPETAPGPEAATFGRAWEQLWRGYHPRWGFGAPDNSAYDHRHAHPEFRNPLSSAEGIQASAEFHGAVIERLAAGKPITLMTFDYESEWQGNREYSVSSLGELLDRELVWSIAEPPEEDDPEPESLVIHAFISQVSAGDPRLGQVWLETCIGAEPLLVIGPELGWLARPHVECVAVHSFDENDIETLRLVERETWDRWKVPHERFPYVDLSRVASYFAARRQAWEELGVRVGTEPQYRTWVNADEFGDIVDALPDDLSLTDWFLIGLESDTAEVTLIVHDSGTCDVQLDPDVMDEDSEMIFEDREHAGSVDFDGIVAVFERAVATLSGGLERW